MSSSSRIPGFYRLDIESRRRVLAKLRELDPSKLAAFDAGALDLETADGMIENVIGTYALPLGLGINFLVNDADYVVPMAVEEPSVVAAASNAAKMIREGGGFRASVARAVMIGQAQITEVADIATGKAAVIEARPELLERARALLPRLHQRGGGLCDIEVRNPAEGMLVVHLLVDCCDAMGANLVNTLTEGLAHRLAELAGGRVGLRILSNLADRRTVTVSASIPDSSLCAKDAPGAGAAIRQAIVAASQFALVDPYRAATHNKGIMNGVDAVLLATGNDWRGVEAGAHAFAARSGTYQPLATWSDKDGQLHGELHMPMAVATVGGALHIHGGAKLALAILGVDSARELAGVVASVGLASNLAALRALATDGIQRGHMSLHARVVARAAGATGDLVDRVASEIASLGDVNTERAKKILARLQKCETLSATEELP